MAQEERQGPCGAVSKAFDTSKARTWFSSCPRCSPRWARNTGAAAVEPSMAPNCQSAASPLRAKTAVNLRMRGVMSIRMSCCPSAIGLYSTRLPVAVPFGISQIMASCQDSGTSAPRRTALYACTRGPCTGSGSSAMRAAVTQLDPGALSSATACLTASLRSCRV